MLRMLSKLLFLNHAGIHQTTTTSSRVSGGLSGTGQAVIILVVIALIGWFFWKIRKK